MVSSGGLTSQAGASHFCQPLISRTDAVEPVVLECLDFDCDRDGITGPSPTPQEEIEVIVDEDEDEGVDEETEEEEEEEEEKEEDKGERSSSGDNTSSSGTIRGPSGPANDSKG